MSRTKATKVREPVQARSQETKRRIMRAAKALFARKGFAGTNSKEIARAARVAIGSFYAYYPDKSLVFRDIAEGFYRRVFDSVRAATLRFEETQRAGAVGAKRIMLSSLIRVLYEAHDIDPALHREIGLMLFSEAAGHAVVEGISAMAEEMDAGVIEWLAGVLRALEADLAPADPRTAAILVFRTAEEVVHRLKQFPGTLPPPETVLPELETMIGRYIFGPRWETDR